MTFLELMEMGVDVRLHKNTFPGGIYELRFDYTDRTQTYRYCHTISHNEWAEISQDKDMFEDFICVKALEALKIPKPEPIEHMRPEFMYKEFNTPVRASDMFDGKMPQTSIGSYGK